MAAADDADVIRRARLGDHKALNVLLGDVAEMLHGYAERQVSRELRARMDPSDVVQTALLEASRDFRAFSGTTAAELRAWVRGILRRNVLDDVKAHVASRKRAVGSERRIDAALDDHGAAPASPATSPSQKVSRREQVTRILPFIAELPASQRAALELWLEGHPVREMASRLDKTELAVASVLKRALEHVRKRAREDARGD